MFDHLGIEFTSISEDAIEARMPVDHRTQQPFGILHGGASVVLAESLGSLGSTCVIDPDTKMAVGVEINANHIRSVRDGYVYGKAAPIHLGRKVHVWEIRINNEEGKLVCISRLTIAIVDKEK